MTVMFKFATTVYPYNLHTLITKLSVENWHTLYINSPMSSWHSAYYLLTLPSLTLRTGMCLSSYLLIYMERLRRTTKTLRIVCVKKKLHTIPTIQAERPSLVSEVSANFLRIFGVPTKIRAGDSSMCQKRYSLSKFAPFIKKPLVSSFVFGLRAK
jgi:hypothetical protein